MANSLQRFNRWFSSLGAAYASIAVVWFFVNLAGNASLPIRELLPRMTVFLILAAGPYLVLLTATLLALDRRVQVAIGVVTGLSLLIAAPFYAGAFYPAQDGEFMVAFAFLGLPTGGLALILAAFAVWARPGGILPSNNAFGSGRADKRRAAQRER
jgi:hypothetical protein